MTVIWKVQSLISCTCNHNIALLVETEQLTTLGLVKYYSIF